MKLKSRALIAVLLITFVIIPRFAFPADDRPSRFISPVTRTWEIAPDPEARDGLEPGLALRLRHVAAENIITLGAGPDPGRDFSRVKLQVWAQAWFTPGLGGHLRFNTERKYWHDCESCADTGEEIIVENLYLEVLNLAHLPIAMRLGRQNLFYGDGFIICDGSPLDGSRTSYVNAGLFTFTLPGLALDLFLISDHEQDDYLPRLNDENTRLAETDECLMGVYFKTMPYAGEESRYHLEPYFVIKRENTEQGLNRISTLGGRLVYPTRRTETRIELAYQTGNLDYIGSEGGTEEDYQEARNVSAFGGTFYFDVNLERLYSLSFGGGYVYLSGDDPKTLAKYEGWNPVLGRWPQWSELYIYTLIPEGGVAYWQNIHFPMIRAGIEPYKRLRLYATYLWMYADKEPAYDPRGQQFESLKRGELFTFRFSYKLEKYLFGHILYEHFSPGGFYNYLWREEGISGEPQGASFLRFELSFAI